MSVVSSVRHYQKSIEKCQGDSTRILHCINRLYDLPVTVQHLQDTGVGKTVNSLRKCEGKVGDAARALVAKWKQMVEEESDPEADTNQIEGDPSKKHHQDSDVTESKWQTEGHDKRDKHRSESKAGGSYDRGQVNDNYKENRKRKKDADRNHSKGKRQHIESEEEGIDEDVGQYDIAVDSDSEPLQIEETEENQTHEEYVPEELSRYNCDDGDLPNAFSSEIQKSDRVSSDDEYQSTSSSTHITSTSKESKHHKKEGHHRSHVKSSKKDRHSSDSKHSKRNSSQTVIFKKESPSDCSSSRELEKVKTSSSRSSSSKSREKSSSSTSSRHDTKPKEKIKEEDSFDLKRVKSEVPAEDFDPRKIKIENTDDTYDLKKVKLETVVKESKPSSSKDYKGAPCSSSKRSSNDLITDSVDKAKVKEKDKRDKHKDKHHSKDERKSKDSRKEKEKFRLPEELEDGVNSSSGTSFAEALGTWIPEKPKKKSSNSQRISSPSSSKPSKLTTSNLEKKTPIKDLITSPRELERQCAAMPLEPLDVDEDFGLPPLNPNYKPLPQPSFYNSPPKKFVSEDEALTNIMYSKVQRTKVFSGNKTGYTSVPTLFDLCTRVLQENIDALEYTGGVPFDLLKPVLERATPDQLFTLEDYNAYLIEDTDVLWEFHCKKDFRNKKREEMETWREMYMRCREERERKLRTLTVNIAAANKAKALPVRKTQLAYVEGTVKPPRNIARKQAKFGTANASANLVPSSQSSSSSGSPGLSSSFTGRTTTTVSQGPAVSVPTPRGSAGGHQPSSCKPKPKAPLMQKALQLIKYNRFKR